MFHITDADFHIQRNRFHSDRAEYHRHWAKWYRESAFPDKLKAAWHDREARMRQFEAEREAEEAKRIESNVFHAPAV